MQKNRQLTLLEPSARKNTWFDDVLEELQVKQGPGWPDAFGSELRSWISANNNERIPTLSLFSGGGGLDIAFHDAGFDIIEMVEIEEKYTETLKANIRNNGLLHGAKVIHSDIREYHPNPAIKIDFIIGGPPCQTFSAAGRRAAGVKGTSDPRGTLFEEYVRILKQLRPRGFLFENVYGIVGAEGGDPWKQIQSAFRAAGYSISSRILDAADYGVPQHRERLFIVGRHIDSTGSEFLFPRPTHGPDAQPPQAYYAAGKAVQGVEPSDNTRLQVSGRWKDLLPGIPPGLNYSFYSSEMGHPRPVFAWRSKFSDFLYKADPNSPVRTIKAQGGAFTGPLSWNNRHFSTSEMKRLQTFPDHYDIIGKRNVQIQQIGNSVPPQMGRILALAVLDQVFHNRVPAKIDYLKANESLGFRTRKRTMTDHYRRVASKAIAALTSKTLPVESHVNRSASIPFSIGPQFLISTPPANGHDHYIGSYEICSESLSAAISRDGQLDSGFTIKITPSSRGWNIPLKSATISSSASELSDLTSAWKFFELIVRLNYGVDDLVQLRGYYQYAPNFLATIDYRDPNNSKHHKVLSAVTASRGVSTQNDVEFFSRSWSIHVDEVLPSLRALKAAGFEVRSNSTNPQIKSGNYLLPYPFPTLNPKSVQLFKSI